MKKLQLTVSVFGSDKDGHVLKNSFVTLTCISEKWESVRQTLTRVLKQDGEMPFHNVENIEVLTC